VNAVMNLRVPQDAGKLSSVQRTGDLSSSAQLHGVSYGNRHICHYSWSRVYLFTHFFYFLQIYNLLYNRAISKYKNLKKRSMT
jgi:hypothetical protein